MASVQVLGTDGQYRTLTRTSDNYFEGGGFVYPTSIIVTSATGAQHSGLLGCKTLCCRGLNPLPVPPSIQLCKLPLRSCSQHHAKHTPTTTTE